MILLKIKHFSFAVLQHSVQYIRFVPKIVWLLAKQQVHFKRFNRIVKNHHRAFSQVLGYIF